MPGSAKSMMILIAGPYRSGTNDDPTLIRNNVEEMESYALEIFRAGHIPILGEWLALHWSLSPGPGRLVTRHSMKYSIRLPFDCWRSVTECFVWAVPRLVPTKWSASAGVSDCTYVTASRKFRRRNDSCGRQSRL